MSNPLYVYVNQDWVNGPDSVTGNGSSVPSVTGTKNISLGYDQSQVSLRGLQDALRDMLQWVEQNCNGAEAIGSTYCPATNAD